jgi:hypothetical protein
VPPLSIVEHLDVLEDLSARLGPRRVPPPMHQLRLERPEEALHYGVVVTVAAPRRAGLRAYRCQPRLVLATRVLAPAVAVVEQPAQQPVFMFLITGTREQFGGAVIGGGQIVRRQVVA